MADTYAVKITSQAREQTQEIVHYISNELKAQDAAIGLLGTLEKEISSLSRFPRRIPLTEEQPWHGYGIQR